MNRVRYGFWVPLFLVVCSASLMAEPLVLKASKDNFGRSNERSRNSGKSEALYVAHSSNIRSIIAFDLSGITNRIEHAAFRFQQKNTMPDALDLVVAPMAQTKNNTKWGEGSGALGVKGQNSTPGEACYGWSAFPDVLWEDSSGKQVRDLGDPQLWGAPFASLRNIQWKEDNWVELSVSAVPLLEKIRESETPIFTIGLWGTSGNGLYAIGSKESGNAPELILTLEEPKKQ